MFKTLNKKILTTTLALMLSVPAFASVAVSPTRIEINENKIKSNYLTTAIEVKGDTKELMRFKAYPGYFTIDSKGEMVMIDDSKNNPHDLSKKVRFVPSEFTVAQGKSQKLRINIANLNQLPDGESRAVLFIEDVNPKEIAVNTGRDGIGAQLIVKTRVGVPIYVDKGKVSKIAEVEYFNLTSKKDGIYTDMKVLSKGNSKIRYSTNIQIIQGKKLIDEFSLSGKVIADNSSYVDRQKIRTSKISLSGEYTVRAIVSYLDENGKRKSIKKEASLNITNKV